jgi:hypothetical protein
MVLQSCAVSLWMGACSVGRNVVSFCYFALPINSNQSRLPSNAWRASLRDVLFCCRCRPAGVNNCTNALAVAEYI